MNVQQLCFECTKALMNGQDITLCLPKGEKWPRGFPRGELLSVGTNGTRNARHDPLKVLAWVQLATKEAQKVYGGFTPGENTMVTPELPPNTVSTTPVV